MSTGPSVLRFRSSLPSVPQAVANFGIGTLARLLGACLQLLLEFCKLGERRIGVRLVLARAAIATSLDIFGAQGGVAIRPVATRRVGGTLAGALASGAVSTWRAPIRLATIGTPG